MTKEIADISTVLENLSPMFWKKGRLQTFKYWPFSKEHRCNPESMATAGFYAIGGKQERDLAECFMCCKQLDGWEPEDDPWQEHQKHQPDCLFIKLNKQDESLLTVKELFELMEHHMKHKVSQEFEKTLESIKVEWKASAIQIPDILEAMKKSQKSID